MSFFAREDFISFRHHNYKKETHEKVDLYEVGPRFEMRPFMIKLGTLIDKNATIEWSLK
jgi:U3 small nucleolar ribonucleoprotein protein IMP4